MSDIAILIFGMFVFAVAIASSLIVVIGPSQPKSNADASNHSAREVETFVKTTAPAASKQS